MGSEAIEESAARWFWKRDKGAWTDADQTQFDAWMGDSVAHRIAYIRLAAAWKRSAKMKALGAGVPRGTIPLRGAWGTARLFDAAASPMQRLLLRRNDHATFDTSNAASLASHPRRTFLAAATAGALTLAMALYAIDVHYFQGAQYSTPIGGLDTVSLADGSQVTLNTDTRMRVSLGDRERKVTLLQGEAFFDVAKDASRPFVVRVLDKRVTAIGTKFSIRRESDDVQIVVTEGRVRLSSAPPMLPFAARNPRPTFLRAGAIAQTARAQVTVREASLPEAEQLLSWRNGFVVFEATTLTNAVAEFNRYNRRKILIADPSIADFRIGGHFRTGNADAFLWLLQSGFPINVDRHDDKILLRAR